MSVLNVQNDNGTLTPAAGHDIQLTTSVVSISQVAGSHIMLDTVTTR